MQKQAYPYCPHGKYVGGCGADYMCFACEMGDELTAEEERQHERAQRQWYEEQETEEGRDAQFWSLPAEVLDGP